MGLRDPQVPWHAKATGIAAIIYLISPIDLIPDVMPIIGWLDDLAMLPLAGYIASRLVPLQTMSELRDRADLAIMRWGPRAFRIALAIVVLWLILAGLGGYFMWRNWAQPLPEPPPAVLTPGSSQGFTPAPTSVQ